MIHKNMQIIFKFLDFMYESFKAIILIYSFQYDLQIRVVIRFHTLI